MSWFSQSKNGEHRGGFVDWALRQSVSLPRNCQIPMSCSCLTSVAGWGTGVTARFGDRQGRAGKASVWLERSRQAARLQMFSRSDHHVDHEPLIITNKNHMEGWNLLRSHTHFRSLRRINKAVHDNTHHDSQHLPLKDPQCHHSGLPDTLPPPPTCDRPILKGLPTHCIRSPHKVSPVAI